jgi:hypothetical protein
LWLFSSSDAANAHTITSVQQNNGVMEISRTKDWMGGLVTPFNLTFSQVDFVEAKMMMDAKMKSSKHGNVFSVLATNATYFSCYLSGKKGESGLLIGCGTPDTDIGEILTVQYNTWHTFRIEINHETAELAFFIDGHPLGSYTDPNPKSFNQTQIFLSLTVWSEGGGLVTGYWDDVRIGKVP